MDSATNERDHTKELAARVRSQVADYLGSLAFSWDRELFFERIERLAALIAFWGARINLTATPGDSHELSFHIIDSLAPLTFSSGEASLRHAFDVRNQVMDLGSGPGFPGLVLASASSASFTLRESRGKRASFLVVAAAEMGLKNVVVESRRINPERTSSRRSRRDAQVGAYDHFDVVMARAYAVPSIFQSAAASALKPGGIAILFANPAQKLSLLDAEKNGLDRFRQVAYTIPRGDRTVERILALWQRR